MLFRRATNSTTMQTQDMLHISPCCFTIFLPISYSTLTELPIFLSKLIMTFVVFQGTKYFC